MTLAALTTLNSGIMFSIVCAVAGLIFAFFLIAAILRKSPGNERMRQIAGAVQEGAKAYLNRQESPSASSRSSFSFCSSSSKIIRRLSAFSSAPYVRSRPVSSECGSPFSRMSAQPRPRRNRATTAMRVAFNGGAVTGLLVVGLALTRRWNFLHGREQMLGRDMAVRSLVGLALGASLISVFARLGGGIYTKGR